MTELAQNQTYEDDGFSQMSLADWIEVIDADIDEAADGVENKGQIAQLVAFLRRKIDEISDMGEDFDDQEEQELMRRWKSDRHRD